MGISGDFPPFSEKLRANCVARHLDPVHVVDEQQVGRINGASVALGTVEPCLGAAASAHFRFAGFPLRKSSGMLPRTV